MRDQKQNKNKMSKKNKVNKLEVAASSGRFIGLTIRTRSSEQRICAKVLNLSPKYVTVWDVNGKATRKFARKSVVA
jgi:hypothetical protein